MSFCAFLPLSAGAAGICAPEDGFCAFASAPDSSFPGINERRLARYLASSYLSCLTLTSPTPPEHPAGGAWGEVGRRSVSQTALLRFIKASFSGKEAEALTLCRSGGAPVSTEFCRALYAAYRGYYTPVCRDAAKEFPNSDPAEFEYFCRTSVYPDPRTCATMKETAGKEACLDILAVITAYSRHDSAACGASPLCGALLAGKPERCGEIRARALRLHPPKPPEGGKKAKELSYSATEMIRAGDLKGARRLLTKALELAPGDPEALMNMCHVKNISGDREAALADCLEAAKQAGLQSEIARPGRTLLRANAMLAASELLIGLERGKEAAELLRRCAGDAPEGWTGCAGALKKLAEEQE